MEEKHNDWFGARYNYNDGCKAPLKLPKDFITIQYENADDESKQTLDGPLFFNMERKNKKDGNWHTRTKVKLLFKRKIALNAVSFQFYQGEPPKPKIEEEKVAEDKDKVGENEDKEKKVEEKKEEE